MVAEHSINSFNMFQFESSVASIPVSSKSSPSFRDSNDDLPRAPPTFTLGRLITQLRHRRCGVRSLLDSLKFTLHDLGGLGRFLRLVPVVTDHIASTNNKTLILFQTSNRIQLRQLRYRDSSRYRSIQSTLRTTAQRIATDLRPAARNDVVSVTHGTVLALSRRIGHCLNRSFRLFNATVVIRGIRQKELCIFDHSPSCT